MHTKVLESLNTNYWMCVSLQARGKEWVAYLEIQREDFYWCAKGRILLLQKDLVKIQLKAKHSLKLKNLLRIMQKTDWELYILLKDT